MMEESERSMFLKLAWLPPDTEFLGVPQRPLSLGSWQAARLMGLRVLNREVELSPEDTYREMMVYLWLHREPVDEVGRAIWGGSWRAVYECDLPDPLPIEMLEHWSLLRERIVSLIEATDIAIRPRPSTSTDDPTPFEVVGPDRTAHELATVARVTGADPRALLWEMPLYQLRQIYHAEMRWHRFWTVRPAGAPLPEGSFEGFEESVLGNLEGDIDTDTVQDE